MGAPVTRADFADLELADFDEIIDVRTPEEHADDHIPGAVCLPVLRKEQHAQVGTLYAQVSPFDARKLGASLVSANIAAHLQDHLKDRDRDYRPLVYCWRGGQRSGSFALVLAQVGWPVTVVQGGYKAYRAHVRSALASLPEKFTYRVLHGLTGCGKTQILHALKDQGAQVLDLEGMAHHLGSLLGQMPDKPVMTQRKFESRIWQALSGFDPDRPVWVEGESAKVGRVFIPQPLFSHLRGAEVYRIEAPVSERVANTIHLYPHWLRDREGLWDLLVKLKARHGAAELVLWREMMDAGDWPALVERLLTVHYDPAYSASGTNLYRDPLHVYSLDQLNERAFATSATKLLSTE